MKWIIPTFILCYGGLGFSQPTQQELWDKAVVNTSKQSEVRWTARKIERNRDRYIEVEKISGVKWEIIAVLHNMECGLRFDQHLHNGDPLTARTWQVPKGRPTTGKPPFTFTVSAVDALRYDKMDKVNWKDLTTSLNALEGYNGWGYRKHGIPSQYLWSATSVAKPGKFIRDNVWSSTAVSSQIGVVPILKELRVEFK